MTTETDIVNKLNAVEKNIVLVSQQFSKLHTDFVDCKKALREIYKFHAQKKSK